MSSPLDSVFPGLIAASLASLADSNHLRGRPRRLDRIPVGFEPPGFRAMRRLLDSANTGESPEQRIGRITAAALCQAREMPRRKTASPFTPKPGGDAVCLVTSQELAQLNKAAEFYAPAQAPKSTKAASSAREGLAAPGRTLNAPDVQSDVCRYCSMMQELLYPTPVPIEVLNHSSRIQTDFDPETNISEAGIDDFQLLVPGTLAALILERSHPLLWDAGSELFELSAPARSRRGEECVEWEPIREDKRAIINEWGKDAFQKAGVPDPIGYLYERVKYPWNDQISAEIVNVLRIRSFANISVKAGQLADAINEQEPARESRGGSRATIASGVRSVVSHCRKGKLPSGARQIDVTTLPTLDPSQEAILSFGYELESCVETNFGLGLRNGGLDIDDGRFDGSAIRFDKIRGEHVRQVTRNDLLHLVFGLQRRYGNSRISVSALLAKVEALPETDEPGSIDEEATKVRAVQSIAENLRSTWGSKEEPWLLTISASKRVRYSYPRDGLSDLWALLTWVAPAFLFTFINRSVCQLPHFLQQDRSVSKYWTNR